jgi:hypothetical protein
MRKWERWGKYHLIEYVEEVIEPEPEPIPDPTPTQPVSQYKVGMTVRWAGRLHRNSAGASPTGMYSARNGVIDIVNDNKFGIHIRGMGWIAESQIIPTEPTVPVKLDQLTPGMRVKWSGRLHRDSTGSNPTGSYREREGTIDIVNKNRYGVHIQRMGWIAPSQVREVVNAVFHTVKAGDTLWAIGNQYGIKWDIIYRNNKTIIGEKPSLLKPGMRLFIK